MKKEKLNKLYWEKGMTIKEIAEKFGVTYHHIHNQMVKHGIKRRLTRLDDPYRRTAPFKGKYFLKKVNGFYYPLKGGVEMKDYYQNKDSFEAQLKLLRDCLDEVEKFSVWNDDLGNEQVSDLKRSLWALESLLEEPTAEELTDEQLKHESEQ